MALKVAFKLFIFCMSVPVGKIYALWKAISINGTDHKTFFIISGLQAADNLMATQCELVLLCHSGWLADFKLGEA